MISLPQELNKNKGMQAILTQLNKLLYGGKDIVFRGSVNLPCKDKKVGQFVIAFFVPFT